MIFGIVANVAQVRVLCNVLVNVFWFDLQHKAVGVCVQQLALKAVLLFQVIIEEFVHHQLGLFRRSFVLCMCTPARSLPNITRLDYSGLATSLRSLSFLLARTSCTFVRFRRFPIVFLKTVLFISL